MSKAEQKEDILWVITVLDDLATDIQDHVFLSQCISNDRFSDGYSEVYRSAAARLRKMFESKCRF